MCCGECDGKHGSFSRTIRNKPQQRNLSFRSRLFPKQYNELEQFEKKDLFNVVEMVKFNNTSDQFQAELKNDIDNIKQCPDILVFASKKSNIYKINTKTTKTTKVTNKGNVR